MHLLFIVIMIGGHILSFAWVCTSNFYSLFSEGALLCMALCCL